MDSGPNHSIGRTIEMHRFPAFEGASVDASAPDAQAVGVSSIARLLIGLGLALVLVGILLAGAAKLGLGRLPGDLSFKAKDFTLHVPLATSLLLSIVLTLLLNWWWGRSR